MIWLLLVIMLSILAIVILIPFNLPLFCLLAVIAGGIGFWVLVNFTRLGKNKGKNSNHGEDNKHSTKTINAASFHKSLILNMSLYLFLAYTISILSIIVYLLAWKAIVVFWIIASIIVATSLLSVVFMGDKAKYKKDSAYHQDKALHHKKLRNILTDIWLWIYTRSLKFLHIMEGSAKTNRIKYADDTTNNHSLHGDNLAQDKEHVNHKQTEPQR